MLHVSPLRINSLTWKAGSMVFLALWFFGAVAGRAQTNSTNLISKVPDKVAWGLTDGDIRWTNQFAKILVAHRDAVSDYLWTKISPGTRSDLLNFDVTPLVLEDLNRILTKETLYTPDRFPVKMLGEDTKQLLAMNPRGEGLLRLNRMLMEDAYRSLIAKRMRAIPDPVSRRIAVVDYDNSLVTFYHEDGRKISTVDAWKDFNESPLAGLNPIRNIPPGSRVSLEFPDGKVVLRLGKVFGDVDVEEGKWWIGGAN